MSGGNLLIDTDLSNRVALEAPVLLAELQSTKLDRDI